MLLECVLAVDTSGLPLRAALDGRPGVVKPNRHELADLWIGRSSNLGDAVAAAQRSPWRWAPGRY